MIYSKVRNVKSPLRANETDAGIDFFIPEFDKKFIEDFNKKNPHSQINTDYIAILPGHRVLIPSGIHVNLEATKRHIKWDGIMLVAHNKSGIGSKLGLDRLAEVIDESYQGEVHLNLVNTSTTQVTILPGDKILQFILEEVSYKMPKEVPFDTLYEDFKGSDRGAGGFGHTGN